MLKIIIGLFMLLWLINILYGLYRPLPAGVSVEGIARPVSNVEFYYDLTYKKDGRIVHEQSIFKQFLKLVKEAEEFIVLDMFLFNDEYDKQHQYPAISRQLAQSLLEKKKAHPEIEISVITDEINTLYGSYIGNILQDFKEEGVNVVVTDMRKLRDSNALYSGLWRVLFQWFGNSGQGWLPNPFSSDGPKLSLRSYLKLLNFKANHRKIIVTEEAVLITSANPHDASAYHSNIACVVRDDEFINDVLESERAVAALSGDKLPLYPIKNTEDGPPQGDIAVRLLTEGKIRSRLLDSIERSEKGDDIQMGMFYLAEKSVINSLVSAANRGVNVRLVLDVNRDAFGRKKIGIPNRPVADFLVKKTNGLIKIRWYETHGEQFHAKLSWVRYEETSEVFAGSANLTRRNIKDYNLETDLYVEASNTSKIIKDVADFFERIWNNNGHYTIDYPKYQEESFFKMQLYRFQEWSGLSTF